MDSIKRFFREHGSSILIFLTNVLAFIIGIIRTVITEVFKEIRGGGG